MDKRLPIIWLTLLFTSTQISGVMAVEMTDESRLVEQLKHSTPPEEVISLNTSGGEIFALFRPERNGNAQGGIILLHDVNHHPDWPEVISPLRRQMPEYGWSTLSVQLPLPALTENI